MGPSLTLGSRDSALALAQTRFVMACLETEYPDIELSLKTYKTQGDLILESALSQIGGKGLFIKELEVALLQGEIDLAVHSMKDMPGDLPDGLEILPFGEREVPLDVLVTNTGQTFWELPQGAVVGTSSLRRQAVLKRLRPDLIYEIIRGNLQTRLKKLEEGPYNALVLASAGLRRLNLESTIAQTFSPTELIPACCQGTLGVEFRSPNLSNASHSQPDIKAFLKPFIQPKTLTATIAERRFLKTLQGGCQIPLGAYAFPLDEHRFQMKGFVASPDGETCIESQIDFLPAEAEQAGKTIALDILARGGDAVLSALSHA